MADKRMHNSRLNAKGLEQFVSEDQARSMAARLGGRYVIIAEAHTASKTVNEDGSEVVSLVIDQVEFVPAEHEDRVRQFQRALYLARPDQYGQSAFDGTSPDEPTVEQTASQLDAAVEVGEDGEPSIWTGDTDEPMPIAHGPEWDGCDFPGCKLDAEHDGDHDIATLDEPATTDA